MIRTTNKWFNCLTWLNNIQRIDRGNSVCNAYDVNGLYDKVRIFAPIRRGDQTEKPSIVLDGCPARCEHHRKQEEKMP